MKNSGSTNCKPGLEQLSTDDERHGDETADEEHQKGLNQEVQRADVLMVGGKQPSQPDPCPRTMVIVVVVTVIVVMSTTSLIANRLLGSRLASVSHRPLVERKFPARCCPTSCRS